MKTEELNLDQGPESSETGVCPNLDLNRIDPERIQSDGNLRQKILDPDYPSYEILLKVADRILNSLEKGDSPHSPLGGR